MVLPTKPQIEYMVAHAHEDRRHGYIIANVIMLVLATTTFTLRFVSRRLGRVKIGLDDWFMVVGMFLTTSYMTMLLVLLRFGMGRHVILAKDPRALAIALITAEVLYAVSICFIKFSILSLYNRLFPQTWFTRTSIAVAIFIGLFTVTKMFGDIFQCVPISSQWTGEPAACITFSDLVIVHGVLNILTDFIIVGLPMPILWNLSLTKMRKVALTIMFTAGAFVCIISIVRLPIVKEVDTPDPSWDFVWPLTISAIELGTAVLAACVPTYRPLFNLISGDAKGDSKSGDSYGPRRKLNSSYGSTPQVPLANLDTVNTDIYQGSGQRPGTEGYTNLTDTTDEKEKVDQNRIFVTK